MMVVKVDLEKAYDKLRREFVRHTLHDIGFHDHFVNLINVNSLASVPNVQVIKTRKYEC